MKNKKTLLIISIILLVIVISITSYIVYKNLNKDANYNNSVPNDNKPLKYEDTFSYENYNGYGKVRILGYAEIKKIPDCYDICGDNYDEIDYLYFHIVETKSQEFLNYLKDLIANTFADEKAIGLGCPTNNKIVYYNSSDIYLMQKYTIKENDATKIINSSKEKPIILELEKLESTSGEGAPSCYSHITNVKIIEQ